MKKRTFLGIFTIFMALMLFWSQQPAPLSAQTDQATKARVTAIAKAAILARNEVIVNGSNEKSPDPLVERAAYVNAMQPHFEKQLHVRAVIAEHRIRYTSFRTSLTVSSLEVQSEKAVLKALEHTVMDMKVGEGDSNAPGNTEYELEHTLVFLKQGNKWNLESIEPYDGFGAASGSQLALEGNIVLPSPSDPIGVGSDIEPLLPEIYTNTLNRQAIVNYAYAYWQNYNPAYRRFDGIEEGGDCTNFASQALRAGGWTDVFGPDRTATNVWFYNSLYQSYTWVNVQYWWQFAWHRPRSRPLSYVSNLKRGDILQMDFDPSVGDGMEHTMIVTKKDKTTGEIYLTYHTTNHKDRPFSDIYAHYPDAWHYAWRSLASFN